MSWGHAHGETTIKPREKAPKITLLIKDDRRGASALWVIGPVLGVVIAWSLIWFRRRRLAGLDPEIRGVVLYWERMWRWARVGGAIVLGVLPILWIPASIAGGHPSAWAIAWLYAGGLAGMTVRPRHR